jgi:hypothetical protein
MSSGEGPVSAASGIEASANAAQPPTRRRIDYRSIGGGGGMTPGNGVA